MERRQLIVLGIILSFVGLGAVIAGFSMITKPDGSGLKMTLDLLIDTPFSDFFIPGLFLLIVIGLFNLAGAILCFMKNKIASIMALLLGIVLVFWILIQVYWVGLISFMQPMIFVTGLVEILLSALLIRRNKISREENREGYIINRPYSAYRYPDRENPDNSGL